ncbi:hypothetical protein [Novipirellula rosea]|uniref:hypothetical protein n=1 Tax=Novipirellula rosea TaxID=1031540 RepID=UPI0031EAC57F
MALRHLLAEHAVLGNPAENFAAPTRVTKIRELGRGRAATAELVEACWDDGRCERCVEKVFDPGLLTRLIYRIAFASPFAYKVNRHAILACFYRRRVVATLLKAADSSVRVAHPLYVRFDPSRRSWILAAEWIDGRGPIPKSTGMIANDEMKTLVDQMHRLERLLIDCGLYGSGWQVAPNSFVSTANLLMPLKPSLTLYPPSANDASETRPFVIIDLESGIPAVLLPRYLFAAWRNGSVFPFDDLDRETLLTSSKSIQDSLRLRGQTALADEFQNDIKQLVECTQRWKDSEIAPFRKPWRWFSSSRQNVYRQESIIRYANEGLADDIGRERLTRNILFWMCFSLIGILPFSLGRRLRKLMGCDRYRRTVCRTAIRSVREVRFRTVILRRHRSRITRQWETDRRLPRGNLRQRLGPISFAWHRLVSALTTPQIHRVISDPHRRRLQYRRTIAILSSACYQAKAGRRTFERFVRTWETRGWIGKDEAIRLRANFSGERISVYSRGLAKHLAIKTLSPIFAPIKVGGVTLYLSGGSIWYAVAAFLILPTMRTAVTLMSMWSNRRADIPHGVAFAVGTIPTLGSSAFIIQMWNADKAISAFLIRDTAIRIGRRLPIYGGADSRTEHAMLALADRFVNRLQSTSDCGGANQETTSQEMIESLPSAASSQRRAA